MEILMQAANEYLGMILAGLTVWRLLVSALILLFTLFLRRPLLNWALDKLELFIQGPDWQKDQDLSDTLSAPLNALILVYGLLLSLNVLPLPVKPFNAAGLLDSAERMAVLFLGMWLLFRIITVMDKTLHEKAKDPGHWLDIGLAPFFTISFRLLVFITGVVVIAQNLGYSVSGLMASLGIGAAALALASKDSLSNLFGSLMILMDKPFTVGDWIKGPDFEGTVEEIGLRSTRIRTFAKTVQNVPNNVLANVIIENMDRRKDKAINMRRVYITLGVAQTAKAHQMDRLVDGIKQILMDEPMVDKSYEPMVYFTDFGVSSYDVMVYFFADTDWRTWLKTKQVVNLKIMEKLDEMGLAFAYPTRTIYMRNDPAGEAAPPRAGEGAGPEGLA